MTLDGSGVYGSGVLVAPEDGLVLTNYHVVEGMTDPRVTFDDGRVVAGKVVELDRALDLALLQVPPQKGAAPVWGDMAAIRPGDEVYAVGCPRRLAFTVSRGIVSFVDRLIEGTRYLQTDLPINDGNSGGPVVNERGELVGLMTFVYRRAQGLSFALPIHYAAERFVRRLGRYATRSRRRARCAANTASGQPNITHSTIAIARMTRAIASRVPRATWRSPVGEPGSACTSCIARAIARRILPSYFLSAEAAGAGAAGSSMVYCAGAGVPDLTKQNLAIAQPATMKPATNAGV